ncbi:hypothetical protein AUC69_05730 [Methyloceanibacter superfactus]|uniref:Gamma-glutamyltranspeptidase n=1 Tax=Methyloceanibacter superfactus TaxID=1774969 RepID=A0A1E3W7E9_9HYPH|nr:gamma-glutamyltransferase [Methyloceanibacter superfactus]ODS01739.1 hypothetical protein AUC69_05730 [Methyloceanibacter superfactus]
MSKDRSVVAAGHQLTVDAAAEILADGGNAFDAALAGLCMSFVAEAVFASPGGGGFLMARRADSDAVQLFDFFVDTPLKRRPADEVEFFPIDADFGPATQEFHIGLGASATPGMAQGLYAMHEAYCRLPMKRLVEPAVRAARAGFPLTSFQAYLFTVIAPILTASDGAKKIFAPGGELMKAGETFRNPALAETLEWLAEDARGSSSRAMWAGRLPPSHAISAAISPPMICATIASPCASLWSGVMAAPAWRSTRRRPPAARSSPMALPISRRSPRTAAPSIRWRCMPPWRRPTRRAPPMATGSRRVSSAESWPTTSARP